MRGLSVFISDIRNCKYLYLVIRTETYLPLLPIYWPIFWMVYCWFTRGKSTLLQCSISYNYLLIFILFLFLIGKSRESELKRINKELANIRSKFKGKYLLFIKRVVCIWELSVCVSQLGIFWCKMFLVIVLGTISLRDYYLSICNHVAWIYNFSGSYA